MNLFWKGVLLAAIPSAFEVFALAFLLVAQHDASLAEAWAMHSAEVLNSSSALFEPVLDEAVRFRGALLSGAPSLADEDFWNTLDLQAARLEQLVSDNPSQVNRAKIIREDLRRYRIALATTYNVAVVGGADALRKRYGPGGGVEVLGRLHGEFNLFQSEERHLDRMRREDARLARDRQQMALYVIILLSLAIGVIAVYIYSRSVGIRLAAVTRNAARISLAEPLEPLVDGQDEITKVDLALHLAAEELAAKQLAQQRAEQQLAQRADALALANEDLRQQRQDNEMFIYSVSHDLRSPLVNLEGFSKELGYSSEDLKAHLKSLDLPDAARLELQRILETDFEPALRYVSAAVSQASRIIDALLKLSRVGRIELREEVLDVAAMVASLVDAAAQTIRESGSIVELGALPPMVGDAAAMGQVFANLLNNAIVYRDPSRQNVIKIDGSTNGTDVSYRVRDNGLGMSAQQLTKLFVAFKRFHPQVSRGEGIGLAYVRRVIDRHSGKISVTSIENEGTTFTISFPERACKE